MYYIVHSTHNILDAAFSRVLIPNLMSRVFDLKNRALQKAHYISTNNCEST
jgi:hypothetical protein